MNEFSLVHSFSLYIYRRYAQKALRCRVAEKAHGLCETVGRGSKIQDLRNPSLGFSSACGVLTAI